MIDITKFKFIKKKYGYCGSWAIWAEEGEFPSSNQDDLTILDPKINNNLLSQLNPNVVFVALNLSSQKLSTPFSNFHSSKPLSKDYKIRFALRNTSFHGGYMTDIIKDLVKKDSREVVKYLKGNPNIEEKNIIAFRKELEDIGSNNPKIIAFGVDAYRILRRHLKHEYNILYMDILLKLKLLVLLHLNHINDCLF